MKKNVILFSLVSLFILSYGQEKTILIYDLINGTIDSIPMIAYDTTILSDHTNYSIGNFNTTIENLEQTTPISNVYPNSDFTYKRQASLDFDLTNYPIRTTVKLTSVENNSLINLCSGSLISRKHVLTAAHCILNPFTNSNVLLHDSLTIYPIFDNGLVNSQFNSSSVSKVYFFKDWDFNGDDFAILELKETIGESTGWISIGFNKVDSILTDGIFYKFSYPSTTVISIDTNEYNGDTLYYNYGNVDIVTNTSLGITNTTGIPGESGSSLVKVQNGQEYTSYGVLNLSNNLNHSKINNWQFYAINDIIKIDLVLKIPKSNKPEILTIHPNPVNNMFKLNYTSEYKIIEAKLIDNLGKIVLKIDETALQSLVDISNFPSGIYYLKLRTNKSMEIKKIIKN